jgi:aromatic-L-amino-acid/L-tryptophan decarboxylase
MTPEEFRELGHKVVDWVANYRSNVSTLPVMSPVTPGQVKEQLSAVPPQQPESFDDILHDLDTIIVPGLSHFTHPRFLAFFPGNSLLAGVLGDYISTGLGSVGLSWQSAPALEEMEELMTDWMRQMLGLSEAWHGVIQDSASTSSLIALLCARERCTDFCLSAGGYQAVVQPLVVYVSKYSHSSIEKAALLAGFGRDNVRVIPSNDQDFAMDSHTLEVAIQADLAEGKLPCCRVCCTRATLPCLVACRQCFGRFGHDIARMSLDVGRH